MDVTSPPPRAPRVAIWGTFDVDNYGDHLFPKIAAKELAKRVAGIAVDAFSPFGWLHPTRLDADGQMVSPLGPYVQERLEAFAAGYDAVLVGGGELIHLNDPLLAPVYSSRPDELTALSPSRWFVEGLGRDREVRCPVVWHALGIPAPFGGHEAERLRAALRGRDYITVRDPYSRDRLQQAGVDRPIDVVPDSALLVDRLYGRDEIDVVAARLRAAGVYPPEGALVIQGCDLVVPHVEEIAAALRSILARHPEVRPVLVETGRCRGDAEFADAIEALLGCSSFRIPPTASLIELVAVLGSSAAFVGSSLHGAITATAFERPFVLLNLAPEPKLDGFATVTDAEAVVVRRAADAPAAFEAALEDTGRRERRQRLQRDVDAHFDRVAGIAVASSAARPPVADTVDDVVRRLDHDAVLRTIAMLQSGCDERMRGADELRALQATRTFRYTRSVRAAYSRARDRARNLR